MSAMRPSCDQQKEVTGVLLSLISSMLHLGQSEVSIWSRDRVSTNHSSPPLVLDPDEDDARGVAARQLLVGLIPLDHRHLLQHNIVSFYNLFIHLSI